MHRVLWSAAVLGATLSLSLHADQLPLQAQDPSMVGERVRVGLLDGGRGEGVVVAWDRQNVSLRTTDDELVAIDWSDVGDVEWFRTRRRTLRGLGLGAAIGGLGTGLVVAVAFDPCTGTGFCIGPNTRAEGFMVGALVGAAFGGAAGLIIGTLVQTSTWEPVVAPGGASASSFSLGLRWRPDRGSPP